MTDLETLDTWSADTAVLIDSIQSLAGPLNILEAGCGRRWSLKLDIPYRLTGIDLDEDALRSRVQDVGDLHEAIHGDLCTPGLIPPKTFDVVYSSFVLEHIDDAEGAMKAMVSGLKPGGLLVLRIPDRDSVYGWVTRHTPFWVHVAYYRFILGQTHAGLPGFAPYPTYLRPIVSRPGIYEFCIRHGCEVLREHGHGYYLSKGRFIAAVRVFVKAVSALSFGALAWRHNSLTYVIAKR